MTKLVQGGFKMIDDALTAGVAPGGLVNRTDIKILVCYVLSHVDAPLSSKDIAEVLSENGLANYFEATAAIQNLVKDGHIVDQEVEKLIISDTGKGISRDLEKHLPFTVKEKALKYAVELIAKEKIERENQVEISKSFYGYNVTCHISGGEFDLMSFSLHVPNKEQALLVKKNFHKRPETYYKLLLSAITGEKELLKTFYNELDFD